MIESYKEEIEQLSEVAYVMSRGSRVTIVFEHNASSNVIHEVEEIVGCSGELSATQMHEPRMEYPESYFMDKE